MNTILLISISISLIAMHLCVSCIAQDSAAPQLNPGWSSEIDEAMENGESEKALQLIERAVEASPDNALVYLVKGMVCFRLGLIDESLLSFDKSIQLDPASKPTCWQRGISLYYLKQF